MDELRAVGGFDEGLRVGEDVDLVWRLATAGHRCRYEPASTVHHRPRSSIRAALGQRVGYGRSAAPLAARHRGALAPVRMSGWSLGVWVLVAARRPVLAVLLAAGTTVALQRKLRDVPPGVSARLVVRGHLAAGRQLADASRRVWWPLALCLALCSRRARLPLVAAYAGPAVLDAARRRSARPLIDAPLQWLDEAAYGVGVWDGVLTTRQVEPLVPEISGWPKRGDG